MSSMAYFSGEKGHEPWRYLDEGTLVGLPATVLGFPPEHRRWSVIATVSLLRGLNPKLECMLRKAGEVASALTLEGS